MSEKNSASAAPFTVRQGDVFVVRRSEPLPKGLERIPRKPKGIVLAEGEKTGHAHVIKSERAALFRDPKLAAIFLQVTCDDPVMLEHEEHTGIALPPGDYEIRIQSEYRPDEIRQVAD
jgi:hypothetical protein